MAIKTFADSRFMDKGVQLQADAANYWQAKKSYAYSCMLCCSRGVGAVQCAQCPIRDAFLNNCIVFERKIPIQEKEYIKKEQELL